MPYAKSLCIAVVTDKKNKARFCLRVTSRRLGRRAVAGRQDDPRAGRPDAGTSRLGWARTLRARRPSLPKRTRARPGAAPCGNPGVGHAPPDGGGEG